MTIKIIKSRLKKLESITLESGSHDSPKDGLCVMEAAAWIAGREHTDGPSCVSPILGAFLRQWNDDLNTEGRQKLKPFIPRILGTDGDGQDEARGWLCADWMIRHFTPTWLDLAGIHESASALRSLPPIQHPAALIAAQPALDTARKEAAAAAMDAARAAAWDAAKAAAWDAAKAAAWDAAINAARAAAINATRAAAWAAAINAARAAAFRAAWDAAINAASAAAMDAASAAAMDAAMDAARDAAWNATKAAARDAARARIEPTKISLQASAFNLLEQLIDPSAPEHRA